MKSNHVVIWILRIIYLCLFVVGGVFCYAADKAGLGGGILIIIAFVCWLCAVPLFLLEQKLNDKKERG